jgi:hypothetical protein
MKYSIEELIPGCREAANPDSISTVRGYGFRVARPLAARAERLARVLA